MTSSCMWSSVGAHAEPILRLGAASPGGLILPDASPTASTMYAPRGVWTDGERIIVSDTGNHRVLIWNAWPGVNGAAADVVLGQPDFTSEGPNAAGLDTSRGLHLPTGLAVIDGDLVIADAWNHRIVVFDGIPTRNFTSPALVIGQANLREVEPNRGTEPALDTLYWPFGFAVVAGVFWVADTGNRRVLGWRGGLPRDGRPADILLGQDSGTERRDNRGGEIGGMTFRWPHALAGDDRTLYVADAGDHRVLGWSPPPIDIEREADAVLGQQDLSLIDEFKNRPQGASRMRFPYAVVSDSERLFVADTSNNRILIWHGWPRAGAGVPADTVLAQPDMDANGENRWQSVEPDTLCWPYGLALTQREGEASTGTILAIADSGNNRATFWRVSGLSGD